MLLTVQDIPDIGKGNTLTKKSQHNNQHHHINLATNQNQYQYNTDTVKRSHTSSSSCTTIDDRRSTTPLQVQPSSSSSILSNTKQSTAYTPTSAATAAKELDYYETSSTTTTITPPPSESGRDTPLININNNNNSLQQHHHINARDKRELTQSSSSSSIIANTNTNTTTTSTLQRNGCNLNGSQQNRDTIMDLQNNHHQSFVYPQQSRTDLVYVTSEDEENIPYHAREDSRPFTYGNPTGVQLSPNGSVNNNNNTSGQGTGMLKMQSGLSSPSLVRKTLVRGTSPGAASTSGNTLSGRKANVRNDFEEMLMQRREKILNEKYSIGDKTPNGSVQYNTTINSSDNNNKWNNISSSSTNGYHYHEPLKRSNTMDGGFGRSISSDG